MTVLDAASHRGLYAIIPTPALPGADHWKSRATANLPETERVVDKLVRAGAGGIIALGTTGECATLPSREYADVARCIVNAAGGRVPVYIGATALGLHDVIERLDVVAEAGADGTLLGLPMWQPLTQEMALSYFADVYSAHPELEIMVYANQRAFRFPFTTATSFWAALPDVAPNVTSSKFSRPDNLRELREAARGRINFMPSDMVAPAFAADDASATTALWSTAAAMGPEPALALIEAIERGEAARVEELSRDIAWANEPIAHLIADQTIFASYNIQIEKVRIDAAGYCAAGPIRPPYHVMPEEYRAAAAEAGHRWHELCERL